jgi:hypothetical protein
MFSVQIICGHEGVPFLYMYAMSSRIRQEAEAPLTFLYVYQHLPPRMRVELKKESRQKESGIISVKCKCCPSLES